MILARNLFFVVCIFVFILLLLSFVPSNKWLLQENTYPVYYATEDFNDQLVHFLVSESFTLKIKKVDSDNEVLIVDFIIKDINPEIKTVFTNLTHLIFDGFKQFANINDIRTRILVQNDHQEQLLIGVLARRDQMNPQRVKDHWKLERLVSYLNDHSTITFGPVWSENKQLPPLQ